jgi:adenylate cyclase
VWAETYQRAFAAEKVFELQDELVPRIVSTVADAHGVLPHTLSESLRDKKPGEMSPLEAVLAGFRYSERLTTQEHKIATEAAERAVQIAPGYSYAWACVSLLAVDEYRAGFNPKPEPLRRAREAALRAVELDATNHRAYHALARVHYCDGNPVAMRNAAEKAIALNPMDCCTLADLGSLYCYTGDWEGGCALVNQALGLNPHHPGWFFFPLIFDRYRKGEYREALDYALRLNLPHFAWTHMALAAIYGQLGQIAEAQKALEQLKALIPDMAALANSPLLHDGERGSTLLDGLRKAGLEIAA